jgi:RHS repeat-associated protein
VGRGSWVSWLNLAYALALLFLLLLPAIPAYAAQPACPNDYECRPVQWTNWCYIPGAFVSSRPTTSYCNQIDSRFPANWIGWRTERESQDWVVGNADYIVSQGALGVAPHSWQNLGSWTWEFYYSRNAAYTDEEFTENRQRRGQVIDANGLFANKGYDTQSKRMMFCPKGWQRESVVNVTATPIEYVGWHCTRPQQQSCPTPITPNPVTIVSGLKSIRISDVVAGDLRFSAEYSSFGTVWRSPEGLGAGGWHTFSKSLETNVTQQVWARRGAADQLVFQATATDWVAKRTDIRDTLTELKDTAGIRTGWKYYEASSESTELYNALGVLQSITTRSGVVQTLAYNANGQLTTVTDSYGRSLTFTYNAANATLGANNIATVTDHLGNVVAYTYDANNNLAIVTYPSGGVKTYLYNEQAYTANTNLPNALTGIIDENGNRFATYQYDAQGRAISTEHVGGVEKYQLNYVSPYAQTIVTDPLGTARTYNFQTILGVVKTTGVSQPCPSCGGSNAQAMTYDANGNVASKTDFNGNRTNYVYDLARNLETSRTEALTSSGATTPQTRTITTVWHPTYRLPTQMTETVTGGNRVTDYTYDTAGNMLTRKVTAPKNDGSTGAAATESRTWTYTYNTLGQVLTAKDPLNKTTTTVYYTATDTATPPQYTKGDVQTITNAVGHVVTMNAYDKNGRPTQMTDANGLITTMTYHPRGWLTSRVVNNGTVTETTTYTYDNVGQLTRVTMPDGSNLFYAYDAAHRLVGMSDQQTGASVAGNGALIFTSSNLAGNKIVYTLDNMGNRIKEQHFDPTGTLAKQKQRAIDALNRLKQDIGGTAYAAPAPVTAPAIDASATANGAPTNAAVTQYSYDNNGNVTTTTDPLGRSTTNQYDALNRLTKVIDPYNGTAKPTIYQYDTSNNLTSVTDPEGKATVYTYNGHNNLIAQSSPDTGSTKFKYNAMGNVIAKIDSVNRCSTTAYDNLHRATSIKYYAASNAATNTQALCFGTIAGTVTPEETHTYTYDSITATLGGPGGKGRISRVADGTGRIDYVYDKNGRITSKTQVVTGATNPNRVITYTYNAAGQQTAMTTPSGQTINYSYGAPSSSNPGKLIGMQLNGTINILTNADYKPFGPNEGWDWGNSGTSLTSTPPINQHARFFDLDYRPTAIGNDPEGYTRNIAWDRANRITGITVPTTGAGSLVPGLANGQSLNQAFAYDTLDRLTQFNAGISGATTAATGLALLPTETFTYDGIGNRKSRTTQAPGSSTTQATNYTHGNSATTPINHWLTSSTGQLPNAYTYDASGNTLTESAARGTTNPLTGAINPTSTTSALTNTYDAKNRLTKTQIGTTATDTVTYKINAMGQRVQKVGAGLYAPSTTATIDAATGNSPLSRSIAFNARFTYDESGRLIGEYAPDGKLIAETIWFNDLPIATLRPKGSNAGTPLGITGTTTGNPANGATATNANNVGNNTTTNRVNVEIFYSHPDHLGTPRVVTRSTIATGANAPNSATANSPGSINKATWRRESDPFGTLLGNSAPNENPQLITGTATQVQAATFIYDEMFPGQHRDRESGKFYNYFRDYDPSVGRYATSDPIGLKGGINTYAYAFSDPLKWSDPDGRTPPALALALGLAKGCITGCAAGMGATLGLCVGRNLMSGVPFKSCADNCFDACEKLDACALGCVAGALVGGITGVLGEPPGMPGAGAGAGASTMFKQLFGFSMCDKMADLGMPFGGEKKAQ